RRAFDFAFCVRADARHVVEYLDELLAGLSPASATDATHVYRVTQHAGAGPWELTLDGEDLLLSKTDWYAVAGLLADFVARAVASIETGVVLHAAAVERGGRAVVCPGPSGAGKSTFAATLASRGFRYLTDEAVAFEDATGSLRALPKALAIGGFSRGVM